MPLAVIPLVMTQGYRRQRPQLRRQGSFSLRESGLLHIDGCVRGLRHRTEVRQGGAVGFAV